MKLTCSKCSKKKPEDEFYRRNSEKCKHRNYRDYRCAVCRSEYSHQRYIANPEPYKKNAAKRRKKFRKQILQEKRAYYAANTKAIRRYKKLKYQENREAQIEKSRQWYINNPKKAKAKNRRNYLTRKNKLKNAIQ